jgi:hypothetical protein
VIPSTIVPDFIPDLPSSVRPGKTLEELGKEGVLKAAAGGEEDGWLCMGMVNGCELWRKRMNNGADGLKLYFTVPATPAKVTSVLKQHMNETKWNPWVETVKVLEEVDENTEILYVCFRTVSPTIKKRDYVLLATSGTCEDGTYVLASLSVSHFRAPETDATLRGECLCRGWVIGEVPGNPNATRLVRVVQYDPKGQDLTEKTKAFIAGEEAAGIVRLNSHIASML